MLSHPHEVFLEVAQRLSFTTASQALFTSQSAVSKQVKALEEHYKTGLFERFTKARRPGLRGEATTGLGLALCKTIVEWHHGTIFVNSVEGEGSTFTVEIPRSEAVSSRVPVELVEVEGQ